MFALSLAKREVPVAYDDTYLSLSISKYKSYKGSDSVQIPYESCNPVLFEKISPAVIARMNGFYLICPKSLDVGLLGNYYSSNFTHIIVEYTKCVGTNAKGVPCKSDTEINNYIDNLSISIMISSAYFDFEDYNDPIKYYVDDHFYYNFMSGFTVSSEISVRQNFVELSDSIFNY